MVSYRISSLRALVLAALLAITFAPRAAEAQDGGGASFETAAPYAFLFDPQTQTVLFEKDADELMAPASMAKLMTAEVVFHMIETGQLELDQEFTVSENAWRSGGATSGGSTMFLELNSSVPLEDLLRGMIVQSGNDACIVLAEGISGTEEAFADLMNRRAREIGLENSTFRNATGLPHPEQRVTARDLGRLAEHIIETYPEHYSYYSQPDFEWNGIRQGNRNPLLGANIGADGLKTGFTEESGYGLTASAVQNEQRLVLVVNGLDSSRQRSEEARRIMQWGFRAFARTELFAEGDVVGQARVFGGDARYVDLRGQGAIAALVPRGAETDFRGRIVYEGPIRAPLEQGAAIGRLVVTNDDRVVVEAPLFAAGDVGRGSLTQRALDGAQELMVGWF